MSKEILNMLDDEIVSELETLESVVVGSDEHVNAVEDLRKLYGLRMEEKKLTNDVECKKTQIDNDRFCTYLKIAVEIGLFIAGMMFENSWRVRGLKFEETGAFTSQTVRRLFDRPFTSFKR